MRNPWGLSKYTGPWSEHSSLWTPEWKRQAGLAEANEGEFWVALSDWRWLYAQAFNTHYRDDWVESTYEGNPKVFEANRQVNGFVQFENDVHQDIVLDCIQNPARLFLAGCKNENTPQTYGYMILDSNLKQINTSPNNGQCNSGAINMKNLAPGKYNIQVYNFDGSAQGHSKIWEMRAFSSERNVTFKQTSWNCLVKEKYYHETC